MRRREQAVYEAALMYYLQDESMDAIARRMNVSRSTVSRLLSAARTTGVVRIDLEQPGASSRPVVRDFEKVFGVRAHVLPVRESVADVQRLEQVSRVAARLVSGWMAPGMVLGIAWGTTTSAVVRSLAPRPCPGSAVVQLNGATSPTSSGPLAGSIISMAAEAFDASAHHFPVPAFFDYASTREAMWRERSVRRVLAMQRRADIVLFGVGSMAGSPTSHVHAAGYLDSDDLEVLQTQQVVGDVCTVMLRKDGSYSDIPLNARATGPTPRELARLERRVCVVAGTSRAAALLAALRSAAVTDLVVDELTALEVLAMAGVAVARG